MRKIATLAALLVVFSTPSVSDAQNAKFLLIRPARAMESRLPKANGVFLITDEKQVSKAEQLFQNNSAFAHKCGALWLVDFWKSPSELSEELTFNAECEKFEHNTKQIIADIKEYTNRIEAAAPQFLYNLKVPSSVAPDVILKDMTGEQNVFFLYGAFQHLPSVTLRVMQTMKFEKNKAAAAETENKAAGKAKIMDLITKLGIQFQTVNVGRVTNPLSGSGDGEMEDVFEVTLKFPKAVEPNDVAKFVVENGGNVQDKRTPEFYFVQLVSSQKVLSVVKDFVQQKYDYIREVFEFPNKK